MAGYFTKNNGYVYDGEETLVAGLPLTSGLFVANTAGVLGLAEAAHVGGYVFRVVEMTEFNELPAVRADVVSVGAAEVFMTEVVDTRTDGESKYGAYTANTGDPVRKRRPQQGDQILVNTAANVVIGDNMVIQADTGLLIKQ